MPQTKLPFIPLLLLISFASVNAVLYTPALPHITQFFGISDNKVQLTLSWYLIGYTIGQLVYGPYANRYGRKKTLYVGIGIAIVSSVMCALSAPFHSFLMLVVGRTLLAFGAGVGLKMSFTLVNECYEPRDASRFTAYMMLAFAITPALGVALGGFLTEHLDWPACFYASAIYGVILMVFVTRLPETLVTPDLKALHWRHLRDQYRLPFTNPVVVSGGFVMGGCTSFVYLFAAIAPFVAIHLHGMDPSDYGVANLIPPIGLIAGLLLSAQLTKQFSLGFLIKMGWGIAGLGVLMFFLASFMPISIVVQLFFPITLIYFGLCFVMANTPSIVMGSLADKAHGSAVMSFINMGTTTLLILGLGFLPISQGLLIGLYMFLIVFMGVLLRGLRL